MKLAFVADTVETKIDSKGKPFLRARGTVTNEKRRVTRTLVVPSWWAHRFTALVPGAHLTIEGSEARVPTTNAQGKKVEGGHFIRGERVLNVLNDNVAANNHKATGRQVAGHDRIGYYRRQHFGPGRAQTKVIWVAATKVKGGAAA